MLDIQDLEWTIARLSRRKNGLQWLLQVAALIELEVEIIVNFGCSQGEETIALLWTFNAIKVLGIDKKSRAISGSEDTLHFIAKEIKRNQWYLKAKKSQVPYEELKWWNDRVPIFFKERLLEEDSIRFIQSDMTQRTELVDNYSDMAYCERVLYQIWCEDSLQYKLNTVSAIEEMTRVVKPGGLIVAVEPLECLTGNQRKVELQQPFARSDLVLLDIPKEIETPENKAVYIFRKERSNNRLS